MTLLSTNTDKAARTKTHQMFKITATSSNTHLKSFAPLIESLLHLTAHPHMQFVASARRHQSSLGRLGLVLSDKYCNQGDVSLAIRRPETWYEPLMSHLTANQQSISCLMHGSTVFYTTINDVIPTSHFLRGKVRYYLFIYYRTRTRSTQEHTIKTEERKKTLRCMH